VKLVGECGSGRLVGGQIVGIEGAAKRIDVVATALTAGMTVEALINLDLSFAPAVLASLGSRADCSPSAREGLVGRKVQARISQSLSLAATSGPHDRLTMFRGTR
jgi:hypothetical protein